jgi:hypothetical protein
LTNFHKICIFNQQSSIVNEMGGGVDIPLFSGKKPGNKNTGSALDT